MARSPLRGGKRHGQAKKNAVQICQVGTVARRQPLAAVRRRRDESTARQGWTAGHRTHDARSCQRHEPDLAPLLAGSDDRALAVEPPPLPRVAGPRGRGTRATRVTPEVAPRHGSDTSKRRPTLRSPGSRARHGRRERRAEWSARASACLLLHSRRRKNVSGLVRGAASAPLHLLRAAAQDRCSVFLPVREEKVPPVPTCPARVLPVPSASLYDLSVICVTEPCAACRAACPIPHEEGDPKFPGGSVWRPRPAFLRGAAVHSRISPFPRTPVDQSRFGTGTPRPCRMGHGMRFYLMARHLVRGGRPCHPVRPATAP